MSLFANYLHSGFIYIDWVFKIVFWFGFIFLIGLWFKISHSCVLHSLHFFVFWVLLFPGILFGSCMAYLE